MKSLRMLIDFTYDDEMMHGDDPVAREWFMQLLLTHKLILHENEDISDEIGEVRVIEVLPDGGRGGPHDYDGLTCRRCGAEYDRTTTSTWCPKYQST